MNWITLLWPMAIAACITMALIHLRIGLWFQDRRIRVAHLSFTMSALAVACTGSFELALMLTDDLASYQAMMRWAEVPIAIMLVSLTAFVWCLFGTGRRWLGVTVMVLSILMLTLNTCLPTSLGIRHAVDIRTLETFGGVTYTLGIMTYGPLTALEVVTAMLLVIYVGDASVRLWRQGERRRALLIGGSIVLFNLGTRLYALLVEVSVMNTPFFFIFPFLLLLAAMGRELSLDVFRAAELSAQLKESEHRIDLAARAATLGFWVWDLKRDEIWATDSARELFGFNMDETISFDRFMARLNVEDRETVRDAVKHSLETLGDYDTEYRIKSPHGQDRWIDARGRVEAGPDGKPYLMRGVVMDVTAKRKTEVEVEQLRRQYSHLSRIALAGELAGSLAHELNQPLAAILSNAQAGLRFMDSGKADDSEIRDILSDIVSDDKRAGDVIRSLRALMRNEPMTSAPVDIRGLMESVMTIMHGEAVLRNIRIESELPETVPRVLGDRTQLQQVLLNILINAADAMEDTTSPLRKILICVRTGQSADVITLSIRDMGHGIPVDVMANIFEPFHTTKEKGMGMGLSICRSIVQSHNGRIWAENNPEGGATFFVELPVIRGKDGA